MLIEQHFVGLGHVSCGTSEVQPPKLSSVPLTASVQTLLLSIVLAPQWDSVWISPFKVARGYCQN